MKNSKQNNRLKIIRYLSIVFCLVFLCVFLNSCAPSPALSELVNNSIANKLVSIAGHSDKDDIFVTDPLADTDNDSSYTKGNTESEEPDTIDEDVKPNNTNPYETAETIDTVQAEDNTDTNNIDYADNGSDIDNNIDTDTSTQSANEQDTTDTYSNAYTQSDGATNAETAKTTSETNGYDSNDTWTANNTQNTNNTDNANNTNNTQNTDNTNNYTNQTEINNNTEANGNTSAQTQTQTETYTRGGFPLYNYGDNAYLGRARIPSVGVNVAIYNTLAQSVCDAYDSACFSYIYTNQTEGHYTVAFADHQNQGFSAIKNCTIGSILYIDGIDGNTYKYTCDWIDYNGHNDTLHLYNSSWNICDNVGGICAYTCNSTANNVTIVHFSAT